MKSMLHAAHQFHCTCASATVRYSVPCNFVDAVIKFGIIGVEKKNCTCATASTALSIGAAHCHCCRYSISPLPQVSCSLISVKLNACTFSCCGSIPSLRLHDNAAFPAFVPLQVSSGVCWQAEPNPHLDSEPRGSNYCTRKRISTRTIQIRACLVRLWSA